MSDTNLQTRKGIAKAFQELPRLDERKKSLFDSYFVRFFISSLIMIAYLKMMNYQVHEGGLKIQLTIFSFILIMLMTSRW